MDRQPRAIDFASYENYEAAMNIWNARQIQRNAAMGNIVDFADVGRLVEPWDIPKPKKNEDISGELKKRHLTKMERDAYHNPKSDWCETKKGDVCKNASSLEVSDIISKIK